MVLHPLKLNFVLVSGHFNWWTIQYLYVYLHSDKGRDGVIWVYCVLFTLDSHRLYWVDMVTINARPSTEDRGITVSEGSKEDTPF